jgi:hypothetical protein
MTHGTRAHGDLPRAVVVVRSALGRRRQILDYQVGQTPAGADIAVRTSAQLDTDALSQELVKALTELGVARRQVSVAAVEDIERTGSTGKLPASSRSLPSETDAKAAWRLSGPTETPNSSNNEALSGRETRSRRARSSGVAARDHRNAA